MQLVAADLTVPAGTPASAPVSLTVPVQQGHVGRVQLTIPSGPNGLAGWALLLAGTVVIPYNGESWVIGNDHTYEWVLDRDVNEGQLTINAYNTGTFQHTFYFYAEWEAINTAGQITASISTGQPADLATTAAVSVLSGAEGE